MNAVVTQSSTSAWHAVTATHPGGRTVQEDAVRAWQAAPSALFAVVADGAGGHGGGDLASQAVVEEASQRWQKQAAEADGAKFLAEWLAAAHEAVNAKTASQREGARAAAVALLVRGSRADWVHAGDCRLYHFRSGERLFRTRDDSVVQVLCDQGEIAEEEMGRHVDQNRLLQCLGGPETPKPRSGGADLQPGDVLLLCTDGFWENLTLAEIADLAASPPSRWHKALPEALGRAVAQGGTRADNATAVLAGFEPRRTSAASFFSGRLLAALLALIVLLLCLAAMKGSLPDLPRLRDLLPRPAPPPTQSTPAAEPET